MFIYICFYVYIFADLLKGSVFTLVSEIPSIETIIIINVLIMTHSKIYECVPVV